jgi:serine/threonine protein kinase
MNCPHCQKALRPDSRFCTGCGRSLDSPRSSSDNSVTAPAVTSVERIDQAKQNRAGDPLIGHLLDGKYQLVSRLGQGGMGTVYRARRIHIGDEVAVKVLHTRYVAEEEAIERFRREARAAAQLRHPNVVVIYDYGEAPDAGVLGYIVMELVEGKPLGDILEQEGRLKPDRAIALMRQICAGVGAAHKRNIVHRDLKPDNIVVLPADGHDDETLKVVDFGLAKLRDQLGLDAKSLTQTGMIIGTPNYMSPEQCRGDELDSRADVYSLGAILFEMLAGEKPFSAPSAAAVIVKHLMDPPPALPNENELPPALTAVCRRALSKNSSDRQADASELSREIGEAAIQPTHRIIFPPPPKLTAPQPESSNTKITGEPNPLPTLTHVGAPHYPSAPPTPEVERKSKGPFIGIMLAIFTVLVIAGVVGAFLLSKSNSTQTENANSNVVTNGNTSSRGGSNNSAGPIGGERAGQTNGSSGESSRLGKAILGKWKTKTGRLEIEFKEAPTGIEGIILRVPDSWPKSRVNIGDAIFVKGKLDGNKIEGLYINVPQNADCPGLETRYSKCVISFEDNNTLKVTNSAWKYSFPACNWSLVTYDDTWNWTRF